ncbi:hypothetical protein FNV43_RR10916 [Rhamnella rubrinervis]|uniref:Pentatricopeptide repeat-containing protein n=1 Tax=Rhamnella rubrinervis TaxID=2594499 RepID=A0A8K0H543_9ROSA|nr:hypothetical protein FNV43_RR10916 [Rhamnella rubrinervis]
MATLHGALLPSNPLLSDASPSHEPNNFCSSKFKFRASTATISSVTDTSVSNQTNPQARFPFIVKKTRNLGNNRRRAETTTGTAQYLSLLNSDNSTGIAQYLSLLDANCVRDFRQVHALAVKLSALETDIMYSALISAYCRLQQWEDLFLLFALMVDEGVLPDKYLVPTVLKACSAMQMTRSGKMIHGYVIRKGLDSDVFVGNALIDMYANCGDLRLSRSVFDAMREKDVVTWTALVSAYMDEGLLDEASEVFHSMVLNGVKPDLISWNALVAGSARNGEIDLALQYMEDMQEKGLKPRVNTWNGIISGCAQNNYFGDALDAFYNMLWYPVDPNFVTIASILPACAGLRNLNLGMTIHGYSLKRQLCGNIHVEGSLIDMYSKCGSNDDAEKVFVEVEHKNTAMWNEMIAVYVNEGKMEKALKFLRLMQTNGSKPDVISYNTILSGLARNGQKKEVYELLSEMVQVDLKPNVVSFNVTISGFQQSGLTYEAMKLFQTMQSPSSDVLSKEEIHGYALRNGFELNVHVSSALIDIYSKCQDIDTAVKVFRRTEGRNTICWNALIAGHVNNMQPECALEVFFEMLLEGLEPNSSTFTVLLLACGEMAALRTGRELHGYVLKCQFDDSNNTIASALIRMYVKCGSILDAKSVFNSEYKDDHGMTQNAIALFEQMELP